MLGLRGLGASLVIVIATAFSASSATAAAPSDPIFPLQVAALERDGLSPAQARRGIEFQRAVQEADLPERLEARLGDAFGGLWFQPSAAKLHVGVTSPAGQREVESIAKGAGLAEDVVATPVRSSWDELRSAQAVWSEKLPDLFASGEVVTAPDPRSNAVEVRLGSEVAPARREALENQGLVGGARAEFVVKDHPRFVLSQRANRCRKFAKNKAFCDPTIVAGTTISTEKKICTAGPAVIRQKFTTNTTETFLLSAGHCTKEQETWSSADENENPFEIGKSLIGLTRQAGDEVDIGLIKVENAKWQNAGQVPVNPAVAYWNAAAAHEPNPVGQQQKPAVNNVTCLSGSSTGTSCGKTLAVGVEFEGGKEMVEVKRVPTEDGDSGGPFFTVAGGTAEVEGTMASSVFEGGKETAVLFSPLEYSFKKLEAKGYELRLLTPANEKRPPCPMPVAGMERCFFSDEYPATLSGAQTGTDVLTVNAGTVKCTTTTYSGSLGEASEAIELTPSYSGCTAFGFIGTTVDVNGCKYKVTVTSKSEADSFKGTVDVVCAGNPITATAFNCWVTIGSQTGLSGVGLTDKTAASPKPDVDISLNLSGIKYTQDSKSFPGCTNGTFTNGTYAGAATLKAQNAEGGATEFEVG